MNKSMVLILFLVLFFSGCVSWNEFKQKNRQNLMKLSPGMNKSDVIKIMGEVEKYRGIYNPYRSSMFSLGSNSLEVLYYYTDNTYKNGINDEDLTPVVFMNGQLVGYGRDLWSQYYSQIEDDPDTKISVNINNMNKSSAY